MPRYALPCQATIWTIVLALIVFVSGCDRPSSSDESEASGDKYGFYANDPSVDLKRRDILPPEDPVPKAEALSTFEVAEGFQVELFAAEPLVEDPVAMEVDEQGRLYVTELHGYPDDKSGSSQIKLLTDTDGDGRPDKSTVFAKGLRMPKGLMRWKDGLLVTDAPDVLYLEDTDGDGTADTREVLLTGFNDANPQLGVNTPVYGLDNWIHLAHRIGGSTVHFPERPDSTYDVSSRNVRLRPDTGELEALAYNTQFGHTFDAWGRHYLNSNSNHIYQGVLAARYLERNPRLLVSSTTEMISDHGASAKMYPITPDPKNRLGKAGGITSAAGLTAYLGGLFPAPYAEDITFVGAPIYNAVHADKLSASGAALTASRIQEQREFLASTDRWFRPVNFYVGPDGALYVIDYYRRILEQPKFLTQEVLETADLYAGAERGRIYRITPKGAKTPSWLGTLSLGEASTAELVQALARANIWWRRTAQRLLVDRQDTAAVEPLEQLARSSTQPTARLHALWTLEGMDALKPALIEAALKDEAAGVRENAIQLAEQHLEESPELAEALVGMGQDPDARVRYQLLLTLGELDTEPARALRRELLFDDVESSWMQLAALSASAAEPMTLYEQARAQLADQETAARRAFFERVSALIGAGQQADAIRRVLRQSTGASPGSDWWRAASLEGLVDGLQQQGSAADALAGERARLAGRFFAAETAPLRAAYLKALDAAGLPDGSAKETALKKAAAVASDQQADPERRADAIRLLGLSDAGAHAKMLRSLIAPREPAPVQQEAVRTLGRLDGEKVGAFLLSKWEGMTPAVRDEAMDVLLGDLDNKKRLFMLFDAIEAGTVSPTAIPRQRDEDLVEHENDAIRKRANEVLRREAGGRQDVIEAYQAALELQGDSREGRPVFDRVCARCHQVGGAGASFGPDLAALENRPPGWILGAILAPNRVVAEGYELWTIQRKNEDAATGVITSETPTSITVRSAGGQETTIPRTSIQSMEEVGVSGMPEGLENQITKQEMADLIAYLMSVQTVN